MLGDTMINKNKCLHCGHEWVQRIEIRPKTCPKCKSYNWDIEPQVKYRQGGGKGGKE